MLASSLAPCTLLIPFFKCGPSVINLQTQLPVSAADACNPFALAFCKEHHSQNLVRPKACDLP